MLRVSRVTYRAISVYLSFVRQLRRELDETPNPHAAIETIMVFRLICDADADGGSVTAKHLIAEVVPEFSSEATALRRLRRLQRCGWIVVAANPHDRRAYAVEPTEKLIVTVDALWKKALKTGTKKRR